MLLLGSRLKTLPVMGLQTGTELAKITEPIIDPANLQIIAYSIDGPLLTERPSYLRLEDVRELSDIGMIVDSSDEFVTSGDVIKIDELVKLQFRLLGMEVRDENARKLGKVIDYSLETLSFTVQQLTVKRPLLHRFKDTELLIHRSAIVEINDESIVIHSQATAPEPTVAEMGGSYINPFRKNETANPQTQSIESS